MTPTGTVTLLHQFNNTDGDLLQSQLAKAGPNAFYGTTYYGGGTGCGRPPFDGCGTVFAITP